MAWLGAIRAHDMTNATIARGVARNHHCFSFDIKTSASSRGIAATAALGARKKPIRLALRLGQGSVNDRLNFCVFVERQFVLCPYPCSGSRRLIRQPNLAEHEKAQMEDIRGQTGKCCPARAGQHSRTVTALFFYRTATSRAVATGRIGAASPFISLANSSRFNDCAPSESALSGHGCTSIINPSAPIARAARLAGAINSRLPVPCEGSASTGKWESSRTSATAARSSVLRVISLSKVLMPRSHSTTFLLPPAKRYSAASNHSFTLAEGPRLSRMGLLHRASCRSRS